MKGGETGCTAQFGSAQLTLESQLLVSSDELPVNQPAI